MPELISNEPLRDESHASESELPALQAVEAGEIVREAVIARTDVGSESVHGSPRRWPMRMVRGATWCAVR
jgi:hypothetical protein